MPIETSRTLASLVADEPARGAVLESLGIDFCCNGDRALDDASEAAGLNLAGVVEALESARGPDATTATPVDIESLSPKALIDHILSTHHEYLHAELPVVRELATKVAGVHGENHPELVEVRNLVSELDDDLTDHMAKEEQILFPVIEGLLAGEREFHCGTVENPIRVMESEHERVGDLLAKIRQLTKDFTLPEDACASYQALYTRLPALEHDTHMHVHKENYLLFPAAIELQSS